MSLVVSMRTLPTGSRTEHLISCCWHCVGRSWNLWEVGIARGSMSLGLGLESSQLCPAPVSFMLLGVMEMWALSLLLLQLHLLSASTSPRRNGFASWNWILFRSHSSTVSLYCVVSFLLYSLKSDFYTHATCKGQRTSESVLSTTWVPETELRPSCLEAFTTEASCQPYLVSKNYRHTEFCLPDFVFMFFLYPFFIILSLLWENTDASFVNWTWKNGTEKLVTYSFYIPEEAGI